MALIFRTALVSYNRSTAQTYLLSNARKAVNGHGSFVGMVQDLRRSKAVYSLSVSSLALTGTDGLTTTYSLASNGDLLSTRAAATEKLAEGFTVLSPTYYARESNYSLVETTIAANARMVALSLAIPKSHRTLRLYSGGRLRNK